jgi:hypothetical protein
VFAHGLGASVAFCAGLLRFDTECAHVGAHLKKGLIKLYMATQGVAKRTAQLHAKNRHPDFVAFEATMAIKGAESANPDEVQKSALVAVMSRQTPPGDRLVHVAPPAMEKPQDQWTPEEYAECQCWAGMVAANAQRQVALDRGDPMAAIGFVKIAADSLKSYHLARQRRVQAELESGRLQPMSAWQDAKVALMKFVSLFASFEGRIAQRANPDNPQHAMRAISQWREEEFNPALESVLAELAL